MISFLWWMFLALAGLFVVGVIGTIVAGVLYSAVTFTLWLGELVSDLIYDWWHSR